MTVAVVRGGIVESRRQVHVAVCRPDGTLVASAGDPARLTTLRSAAKPFQAQPLVASGAFDAFGMDDEDGAAVVAARADEPNPVTQDEMDAGSIELF